VNGLPTMLSERIYNFFNILQSLRLVVKLLIQGLILAVILTIIQLWLEGARGSFMLYMPPLGFFFLMFTTYLIQPIVIGVINIFIINVLYGTRGWQVGFWLNGIFLVLLFSTVNVVMQTSFGLPFVYVASIDIVALALPFGCIARFSNGGWKKPIN
jgi:hypothetical protein